MELGLNVNVTRGARALHVQVEHRERPVEVVVGQVFAGGVALATRTVECAEAGAVTAGLVRALMDSTARDLIAQCEAGRFDLARPAPLAASAPRPLALRAAGQAPQGPPPPTPRATLSPPLATPLAPATEPATEKATPLVTLCAPLASLSTQELLSQPLAALIAAHIAPLGGGGAPPPTEDP